MKTVRLLLKILACLAATLILAELGFRLYNRIHPSFIFPTSTYNRFRGTPFSKHFDFILNSQGFKDLEYERKKTPGVYRIIGLGDSFVFGIVPYEHNFLTLLETRLNRGAQRVEVINMGIPGTGLGDYFSLLADEGLDYDPDLVLCFFFLGNDLIRTIKPETTFYVGSFFRYLFRILPEYEGRTFGKKKYVDTRPTYKPGAFLKLEKKRSRIFLKDWSEFEELCDQALDVVTSMKTHCDRRQVEFLVVLIPDEVQVNQALQQQVVRTWEGLDPENIDFRRPNRLLLAKFEDRGIAAVDLTESFAHKSKVLRLYKPRDTHWNIAGNRFAAAVMSESLRHRFLPGS